MTSAAPLFDGWLEEFFASYYRHRPVNATFIGIHDYDHLLPDFSPRGVEDCISEMESLLGRLRALSPETLTEAQAMDGRLAEGFLEIQLWEHGSSHFHKGNPSLYTGEAVFGIISLLRHSFAPLTQRLESAAERMRAIPTLLQQGMANVNEAHLAWTERALRECTGARALLGNGIDILMREEGISDSHLRAAANVALAAFQEFQAYLETELKARPTQDYACGEEAFSLMLHRGHFLDMAPPDVEAYAWDALRESRGFLEDHAGEFGATDWRRALPLLSDHHPDVDHYYRRFQEMRDGCRAAAEEYQLVTWPEYPLEFKPRPGWASEAAPYLYFLPDHPAPAFGAPPVVEYLVTPIDKDLPPAMQESLLRSTNDSVIKLNHAVHHGGLGHHVQNWYAYNRAASRIGQVAAVDCASRLAMFCAGTMAEGWATYSVSLMDEVGFLTPLEHYSLHHARLRAAARAIVDVNLHLGKFTLEQAEEFYEEQVGMNQAAARSEAVKNSMFPGAAMMYLIGSDRIRRLRRDLSAREGASFNLRSFHDRFLSYGSVPVALIAQAMLQ